MAKDELINWLRMTSGKTADEQDQFIKGIANYLQTAGYYDSPEGISFENLLIIVKQWLERKIPRKKREKMGSEELIGHFLDTLEYVMNYWQIYGHFNLDLSVAFYRKNFEFNTFDHNYPTNQSATTVTDHDITTITSNRVDSSFYPFTLTSETPHIFEQPQNRFESQMNLYSPILSSSCYKFTFLEDEYFWDADIDGTLVPLCVSTPNSTFDVFEPDIIPSPMSENIFEKSTFHQHIPENITGVKISESSDTLLGSIKHITSALAPNTPKREFLDTIEISALHNSTEITISSIGTTFLLEGSNYHSNHPDSLDSTNNHNTAIILDLADSRTTLNDSDSEFNISPVREMSDLYRDSILSRVTLNVNSVKDKEHSKTSVKSEDLFIGSSQKGKCYHKIHRRKET